MLNHCYWFCVEPVTLHSERPSAGSSALWLPPHSSFLSPRLTEQVSRETHGWFHHTVKIEPTHLNRKHGPSAVPSAHIEHTPRPSSSLHIAFSSRCCAHCHAVVHATSQASDVHSFLTLRPLLLGFMLWVTSSGRLLLAPTWGWTSPSPNVLTAPCTYFLNCLYQPVFSHKSMYCSISHGPYQVHCQTCCIWMVLGK